MKNKMKQPQNPRDMKPFELWTAQLPVEKGGSLKCGRRPVVVVSEETYGSLPHVSVVPLTRDLSSLQLPTHVLLCSRFLDSPSRALCEQVMTLEKSRLIRRIGYVEDAFDRFALRRALAVHLNLTSVQELGIQENSLYTPLCAV